jgi:hypothetical protein
MNEIIKKFAIRSQVASEENGELMNPCGQPCEMSTEVQEFAELIIAECYNVIIKSQPSGFNPDTALDAILKHFGD